MWIEAAVDFRRISCCAFWPMINGPTVDPDWDFANGGQLVPLGAMAYLNFEVKSWDCNYAYAALLDKSSNPRSYSGMIAHNNNSSGLGIKEVWVESATPDWAETFWTIYEGANCTGKSAILPVQDSRLFTPWKDYLQHQLGFNRNMRFRSFMPAVNDEIPPYDLRLLTVGGTELEIFFNPEGC